MEFYSPVDNGWARAAEAVIDPDFSGYTFFVNQLALSGDGGFRFLVYGSSPGDSATPLKMRVFSYNNGHVTQIGETIRFPEAW